jgi:hypothetical protein
LATDIVITRNGLPYESRVWSKPDARTSSLELRRIMTRESIKSPPDFPGGVRTDFYELYWADLTAGTPLKTFIAWFWDLLGGHLAACRQTFDRHGSSCGSSRRS